MLLTIQAFTFSDVVFQKAFGLSFTSVTKPLLALIAPPSRRNSLAIFKAHPTSPLRGFHWDVHPSGAGRYIGVWPSSILS